MAVTDGRTSPYNYSNPPVFEKKDLPNLNLWLCTSKMNSDTIISASRAAGNTTNPIRWFLFKLTEGHSFPYPFDSPPHCWVSIQRETERKTNGEWDGDKVCGSVHCRQYSQRIEWCSWSCSSNLSSSLSSFSPSTSHPLNFSPSHARTTCSTYDTVFASQDIFVSICVCLCV